MEEIQDEEPEADPHMSFEEAKELWEDGFYQDDYVLKSRVGELIYDSMDTVGKSVEDFSEEQMAVIRKLAEQERINEEYSGNYLVGPRKNLLVDPQKDIDVKYIAIGGVEREDKSIEESHEIVKCKPADNLEIASWNSFVRKLDEYHGHHPVQ